MPSSRSIPEQGQIVTVRQRRFVVADVQNSALPADPLASEINSSFHLLTLNSIEDEPSGESIQVIWEIEPGTRIEEKVGLPQPQGFDPPHIHDAFLNAVRWGAVSSADVRALQAPFRSGIEIEDYQLDPPMMSASVKPSKPDSSFRNSSFATALEPFSSFAPRASSHIGMAKCATNSVWNSVSSTVS
jgi:hypothetical protein